MSFIFFISFIAGTVLIITRPKGDEANRWLALCSYCAAIGALSNVINEEAIPGLKMIGFQNDVVFFILHELSIYTQFFGQAIAPYACLMYAIVFTKIATTKTKNWLALVLLTPIIPMTFRTQFYPDIAIDFKFFLVWCTPYYIVATYLMFRSWYTEKNRTIKKSKFTVLVIVVPIWLSVYFFNNIPAAFEVESEVFRALPITFGIGFLLFVVYIFLSGVFGLKVKVEQQVLDRSIQIMSSGTAVLNHTIKNEIHKIKFFFLIAQEAVGKKDHTEAKEAIESALPAIEHIEHMVDRIKSKTEEIVLRENHHNLDEIVLSAIRSFETVSKSQGIQIEVSVLDKIVIECDDVLLGEVIKNILGSAIEAIKRGDRGFIQVNLYRLKTDIVLKIKDDGMGIPDEELPRIMEPFFSTKRNPKNHGLGLSFCYNVMKAHQGTITITSEVGVGTSVVLRFPKKRYIPSN